MDEDLKDRPVPLDDSLRDYTERALKKIREGIDLLMFAEEAYTRALACDSEKGESWQKRRDGFRTEGTEALHKVQRLLGID